jgi:hypothetical protein
MAETRTIRGCNGGQGWINIFPETTGRNRGEPSLNHPRNPAASRDLWRTKKPPTGCNRSRSDHHAIGARNG